MFCLSYDGMLSLGYTRVDLRVLVPLKMSGSLVCLKILLNSSLGTGTQGTEMKIFFLTSSPVSGFMMEVSGFFSGSLITQST